MIIKRIQSLYNPERYHGWGRSKNYFEGWYYKMISADEKHAIAVIPGIAMDENGKKQAFIQVLDGKNLKADYVKFLSSSFKVGKGEFQLNMEGNHFSSSKLRLDIPGFKGEIEFENQVQWRKKLYSPGIMGPFSFMPFMECYHGILSMDHTVKGSLTIDGKEIDFNNGRGYMEKDWGRSFPIAYFWMQSNHFSKEGVSLKASIAKIPFAKRKFVGFIAGLWLDGKLIRFTTYNASKLIRSFADENTVEIKMKNPKYILHINATRGETTELASPILGFMDGRVEESMTAVLEVKLIEKKTGRVIFEDKGRNAGLEVAGKIDEIII